MASISTERFKALLDRVRREAKEKEEKEALFSLSSLLTEQKIERVDLSSLGLREVKTVEQREAFTNIVTDMMIERNKNFITIGKPTSIVYTISELEIARDLNEEDTSLQLPKLEEKKEAESGRGRRVLGVARDDLLLNQKQQLAISYAVNKKDFVLIGSAGTGKTTTVRYISRELIEQELAPLLQSNTKYLRMNTPGIAIVSFTRKAVNNIRHAVVDELKHQTVTLHKLLEFQPVRYEIEDPSMPGTYKNTMRFEPARNAMKPLPYDLSLVIFEESSMISVDLYDKLQEAMPHKHQEIFLGDIQQLPPVFGLAILGFKMLQLPIVELTEIYRQSMGPILELAHAVLSGEQEQFSPRAKAVKVPFTTATGEKKILDLKEFPALKAFSKKSDKNQVIIQPWQKRLSSDNAVMAYSRTVCTWIEQGFFSPEEDIILCPYNEAFGTLELNLEISDFLGQKRKAVVHEVIAGFKKLYLAVGDRVLYDKEDAVITTIRANGSYFGAAYQPASDKLNRWGSYAKISEEEKTKLLHSSEEMDLLSLDNFLSSDVTSNIEERVQACSHILEVQLTYGSIYSGDKKSDDDEDTVVLSTVGQVKNLLGGYACTVHKFQGSENDRVFLALHHSHSKLVSRELLYTAITRAKKFLHIACEPDTFYKGVASQRIKGDTLAEKAEFFKGKEMAQKNNGKKQGEML